MLTIHVRGMSDPSAYHLETLLRKRLKKDFDHVELCVHNAVKLSSVNQDLVKPYLMIEYSDSAELGQLVHKIKQSNILIEMRYTKIGLIPVI